MAGKQQSEESRRLGRRRSYEAPSIRRHAASGRARVRIDGKTIWCGPWTGDKPSPQAVDKFHAIVDAWNRRRLAGPSETDLPSRPVPASPPATEAAPPRETVPAVEPAGSVTVSLAELAAAYVEFAKRHYLRPDGRHTSSVDCIRMMTRAIEPYLHLPVTSFGPLYFSQVLDSLAKKKYCRTTCNQVGKQIRLMVRWGVSQELVDASALVRLQSAKLLAKGRSDAVEPKKVRPVADEVIDKTLPFLSPVVADMVRLQRLTGARPGEVCDLTHASIDRSTEHWFAELPRHKTAYADKDRCLHFGPEAREILTPYLNSPVGPYVFSPRQSEAIRRKEQRKKRKAPIFPSSDNRKRSGGRRRFKNGYSMRVYEKAIERGARKAQVEHWAPNRIRHTFATDVRRRFDLDTARTLLNHANEKTTMIYAERDFAKARTVIEEVG